MDSMPGTIKVTFIWGIPDGGTQEWYEGLRFIPSVGEGVTLIDDTSEYEGTVSCVDHFIDKAVHTILITLEKVTGG